MPGQETIQIQCGRHTLTLEPPTLLHWIPRGDVSALEIERFAAFVREHTRGLPFVFIMNAVADLGLVPAGTRKIIQREVPRLPIRGLAYYGGGFQKRILLKLILAPLRILSPDTRIPVRFFDTEAEARAWLAERGRELAAERGSSAP
jgi:hypothetical protein